jgi:alkanesulfonate monooxygenase SsuD/methylene tetrahydromethanopterin reductase-like flavin-dependent oxidoreductase (luciferase family)
LLSWHRLRLAGRHPSCQSRLTVFADFIRNFNYLRVAHGDTSGRTAYLADFDARLAEGLHIVGSPDTVKRRVQEHLQSTGSNYFVGSFCFGTLSSAQTLRSMRLFAEEVMPACWRIGSPSNSNFGFQPVSSDDCSSRPRSMKSIK